MVTALFHPQILIVPFGSVLYDEAVELRNRVLRVPLNLQFTSPQLSKEWKHYHFVYLDQISMKVIGVLVMAPVDSVTVKMRQVAVDPFCQGQGIGRAMVVFAENWARINGFDRIKLSARKQAVPFYSKMGYKTHGEEYLEVGIPHRDMYKNLI